MDHGHDRSESGNRPNQPTTTATFHGPTVRSAPVSTLSPAFGAPAKVTVGSTVPSVAIVTGATTTSPETGLANVTGSDRIYMMQDGRVAESGTHRQLLERKGQYEKLYRTQMELEQYGKDQYGKEAAV